MKEEKSKHAELQNTAIRWLYNKGCSVFAQEVPTRNGIADALGIMTRDEHCVYYIEAKASRGDLMCEKQKAVYVRATKPYAIFGEAVKTPDTGIDFYYFILADGVKIGKDEYPMFGVICESGSVVRRARRMRRESDTQRLIEAVAHVLVYKVFGKLYLK